MKTMEEIYGIPARIAEMATFVKTHLDTEDGYRAYYEMTKTITDEDLPDDILCDLAADFAWDGRLDAAFTRLAMADGRPDLI